MAAARPSSSDDPRHFAYIEDRFTRGSSVYRALARQLYGNPDHLEHIRAEVFDHLVRGYEDNTDLLNHGYGSLRITFSMTTGVQHPANLRFGQQIGETPLSWLGYNALT